MQIKLEKINIFILIHYFQSHNFIDLDSVLNKTQNTKQREGIKIFKRDSPWVLTLKMRSQWSSRFGAPLWLRGDGLWLPGGGTRRRRCLGVAVMVETLLLMPFSSHNHSHSDKRGWCGEGGVWRRRQRVIRHER